MTSKLQQSEIGFSRAIGEVFITWKCLVLILFLSLFGECLNCESLSDFQSPQSTSEETIKLKLLFSEAVFIANIVAVLPHPIDKQIFILRANSSKFIKGCGPKTMNIHISLDTANCLIKRNAQSQNSEDENLVTRKEDSGPTDIVRYFHKKRVIVFGCKRDSKGVNWDQNIADNFPSLFLYSQQFSERLVNIANAEFECADCCESLTECVGNFKEFQKLGEKQKGQDSQTDQQALAKFQRIFADFGLGKNKEAIISFFGEGAGGK